MKTKEKKQGRNLPPPQKLKVLFFSGGKGPLSNVSAGAELPVAISSFLHSLSTADI